MKPDHSLSQKIFQRLHFIVLAMIAVTVVAGEIFLYSVIRSENFKGTSKTETALNDPRSPLATELSHIKIIQAPSPVPTAADPRTAQQSVEISVGLATHSAVAQTANSSTDLSQQPPIAKPTSPPNLPTTHGHLPYTDAGVASQLESVGHFVRENYEREEAFDAEAALAFKKMQYDAQIEGVELMVVSGFRAVADQQALFASQIERKGSEAAAAQYSAPPGHSEHHTGYAVDITDANQPDTDLKLSFENTKAYQWLNSNAHEYGFEESFPKNNAQGVSFEPWHWRYVGTPRAQSVFATARTYFPSR